MGLLKLSPAQSLPLVAEFLDRPDAQACGMAALALGESHLSEAFSRGDRSPVCGDWGFRAILWLSL